MTALEVMLAVFLPLLVGLLILENGLKDRGLWHVLICGVTLLLLAVPIVNTLLGPTAALIAFMVIIVGMVLFTR